VIAHGDYEQEKPEPYVIQFLNFTNNIDDIVPFVLGVERTYGGDWEEAYEFALQTARTKFSWTSGYTKALVMIGDAVPHSKDQYQNIDWEEELQLLVKHNVTVHGVQCVTTPTEKEDSSNFFRSLTRIGGGTLIKLEEFQRMKEIFVGMCYKVAVEVQYKAREAEIRERVGKLQKQGSATLVLNEQDKELEEDLTTEELLKIHNTVHETNAKSVTIKGEEHTISEGAAGCRFVRIGGRTYIQQNKQKDSKYAKMALEGKCITWICRQGRWGLIIDNDIIRS